MIPAVRTWVLLFFLLGCADSHVIGASGDASARDADVSQTDAGAAVDAVTPVFAPVPVREADGASLCARVAEDDAAIRLWSNAQGVFVLDHSGLLHHTGTGWTPWYQASVRERFVGVSASRDNMPLLYGSASSSEGCALMEVTAPHESHCLASPPPAPIDEGQPTVVTAVQQGGEAGYVVQNAIVYLGYPEAWAGAEWGMRDDSEPPLPVPDAIWGEVGFVVSLTHNAIWMGPWNWGVRLDAPPGPYSALWAEARDKIWIGTDDGRLLLFDGSEWTNVAIHARSISDLWGDGDRIFVGTDASIISLATDSGLQTTLLEWNPALAHLTDLWGDVARDEIYLAFHSPTDSSSSCRGFVVRYNGDYFQRF